MRAGINHSPVWSPDGRFIAFRKPWNGTLNLWVKKAEEPFGQAKRVTAETRRPIPSFFWSRDSRFVLFVQDQGGDENFNVYAVSPTAAPAAGADVPAARNLTDAKGALAGAIVVRPTPSSDASTLRSMRRPRTYMPTAYSNASSRVRRSP